MEPADGIPVIHGVEGGNFVDSHRGHFKQACYFVHDADACEAELPLAEVEEGHYGSFLVLGGVSFKDLGDELLVDGIELEGYGWIVLRTVAVLETCVSRSVYMGIVGRSTYHL